MLSKNHIVLIVSVLFCVVLFGEETEHPKGPMYEQLCRAVIRLEHQEIRVRLGAAKPEAGTLPNGTAFFVRTGNELYVVSARHVVDVGYHLFSRVQLRNPNTGDNRLFRLELPHTKWVYHPNHGDKDTYYVDVAAMKIRVHNPYHPSYFGYEPNDPEGKKTNQLLSTDAQPPEPVLAFGFPVDLGFELTEQRPMARWGVMSMRTDKEFLRLRRDGVTRFVEERCCIIDARMFPGNSGSPVMNQPRTGFKTVSG